MNALSILVVIFYFSVPLIAMFLLTKLGRTVWSILSGDKHGLSDCNPCEKDLPYIESQEWRRLNDRYQERGGWWS